MLQPITDTSKVITAQPLLRHTVKAQNITENPMDELINERDSINPPHLETNPTATAAIDMDDRFSQFKPSKKEPPPENTEGDKNQADDAGWCIACLESTECALDCWDCCTTCYDAGCCNCCDSADNGGCNCVDCLECCELCSND